MTSNSYLYEKVNLLELKEWLRRELLSFFENFNGKKVDNVNGNVEVIKNKN